MNASNFRSVRMHVLSGAACAAALLLGTTALAQTEDTSIKASAHTLKA